MTKYIIDYGRLPSFEAVRALVYDRSYPLLGTEPPESLTAFRAAIDSGGTATEGTYSRTEEVYEFVWKYGAPTLYAIKGSPTEVGTTIRFNQVNKMPGRKTPIIGGIQLGIIDTGKIKSLLFNCLTNKEATRPIKIYGYDPERETQEGLHDVLIDQLTSERQVKNTQGKLVWVKHKKDNHYLDCLMMACACGDVSWTPSVSMFAEVRRREVEGAALQKFVKPLKSTDYAKDNKGRRRRRGW